MLRADDPIRFVFEQSVVASPGTKFTYNSGISIALGKIIANVAGKPVDKFAEQALFEPLGISDFYWSKYPGEIVQTGGGLFLRSRDIAKIGSLLLSDGRWNDKQVVSQEWVKQSTTAHVDAAQIPAAAHADGYGYQWWLSSFQVGDKRLASSMPADEGGNSSLRFLSCNWSSWLPARPTNPLLFQPLDMVKNYIVPAALK